VDWYNGYSPDERNAMGRAAYPDHARQPPCAMCGDPNPRKMQTHAEDYSQPFRWDPPAAYPVCTTCHSRIHSRFDAPAKRRSFLEFLRRGWYAREVPSVEMDRHAKHGQGYAWRELPHPAPVRRGKHAWWWEALTLAKESKRSQAARPRP
jgi:hypothetical protein